MKIIAESFDSEWCRMFIVTTFLQIYDSEEVKQKY